MHSLQASDNQTLVCTVGELRVWPGASNVIAGSVQLSVDIRSQVSFQTLGSTQAATKEHATEQTPSNYVPLKAASSFHLLGACLTGGAAGHGNVGTCGDAKAWTGGASWSICIRKASQGKKHVEMPEIKSAMCLRVPEKVYDTCLVHNVSHILRSWLSL